MEGEPETGLEQPERRGDAEIGTLRLTYEELQRERSIRVAPAARLLLCARSPAPARRC